MKVAEPRKVDPSREELLDIVNNSFTKDRNMLRSVSPDFVDKIVELFPDGPPSLEVGAAVVSAELDRCFREVYGDDSPPPTATINTDKHYLIESPEGSTYAALKQGKTWRISITSPLSPNGKKVQLTQILTGDKLKAVMLLFQLVSGITAIRGKLGVNFDRAIERKVRLGSVAPLLAIVGSKDERIFDYVYDDKHEARQSACNALAHLLEVDDPAEMNRIGIENLDIDEILIIGTMCLHEMWRERHGNMFQQELAMAKNNGGHVWWLITGGRKPMKKVINTLQSNRHYVVLHNDEECYLKVQGSELKFVEGLSSELNCRAKRCDEPDFEETLCGKRHVNPNYHSRKCNACQRVKANDEAALKSKEAAEAAQAAETAELEAKVARAEATQQNKSAVAAEPAYPSSTSPDGKFSSGVGSTHPKNPIIPPRNTKREEEKEWAARNGEVIVVQGATEGIDPLDFEALAQDYRRVAERLLARASWYEETADKYEALLRPSDAVRQAEEALATAKANEDADREAKVAALVKLMSSGPPEST
jgi:hypothetical protein